jgi:hypothetical protein
LGPMPKKDLHNAVTNLVSAQLKQITMNLLEESSNDTLQGKKIFSEGISDEETGSSPAPKNPKETNKPGISEPNEYKNQVVILEGVDENLKKDPAKLWKALKLVKLNLEVKMGGIRLTVTVSRDILVQPKKPSDCCLLLKPDAFKSPCA